MSQVHRGRRGLSTTGFPGRGVADATRPPQAERVNVDRKLQIKPGQAVAVLNAPPGLVLPGVSVAATVAIDHTRSALRLRPATG